jgi:hypothetical protein
MKNEYGLDISYFEDKIQTQVLPSIHNMSPAEFARECARMAMAANPAVFQELEFVRPQSQPCERFEAIERQWQYSLDELTAVQHELSQKDVILESVKAIVDAFRAGSVEDDAFPIAFYDINRVLHAGREAMQGRYALRSLLAPSQVQSQLLRDLIVQERPLFEAQSPVQITFTEKGTYSPGVQMRWEGWLSKCGDLARQQQALGAFAYDGNLHKQLFMALPSAPGDATFIDLVKLLLSYVQMLESTSNEQRLDTTRELFADSASALMKLAQANVEIVTLQERLSNRAADQIGQLEELLATKEALRLACPQQPDGMQSQGHALSNAGREAFSNSILVALNAYRLRTQHDGDGAGFPLVDALTHNDQSDISTGLEEIEYLSDHLYSELVDRLPKLIGSE